MKAICSKDEEADLERNAWETKHKEQVESDKKSGVKCTYEEQKAREKETFQNK